MVNGQGQKNAFTGVDVAFSDELVSELTEQDNPVSA